MQNTDRTVVAPPRTWDARLARRLVTPLRETWVRPNHLTTVRLVVGVAGALALAHGGWVTGNVGAFLIVLSNFIDHTDGELARISGRSSRFGHVYDLASDALITVLLFSCMGIGVAKRGDAAIALPELHELLGAIAGSAVALIFFLRMRIETIEGKASTQQSLLAGFETEDILYLLPIVTLADVVRPFLLIAAVGAPAFALWVAFDYRRVVRRHVAPAVMAGAGATR